MGAAFQFIFCWVTLYGILFLCQSSEVIFLIPHRLLWINHAAFVGFIPVIGVVITHLFGINERVVEFCSVIE